MCRVNFPCLIIFKLINLINYHFLFPQFISLNDIGILVNQVSSYDFTSLILSERNKVLLAIHPFLSPYRSPSCYARCLASPSSIKNVNNKETQIRRDGRGGCGNMARVVSASAKPPRERGMSDNHPSA